jgi:hypothetical protein
MAGPTLEITSEEHPQEASHAAPHAARAVVVAVEVARAVVATVEVARTVAVVGVVVILVMAITKLASTCRCIRDNTVHARWNECHSQTKQLGWVLLK